MGLWSRCEDCAAFKLGACRGVPSEAEGCFLDDEDSDTVDNTAE
jgi:hypothetical protein